MYDLKFLTPGLDASLNALFIAHIDSGHGHGFEGHGLRHRIRVTAAADRKRGRFAAGQQAQCNRVADEPVPGRKQYVRNLLKRDFISAGIKELGTGSRKQQAAKFNG